MATMVLPIDLSEDATLEEESLRSLLSDDALTPRDRLLLVEARFAHDSAPDPLRVPNGERFADPARGGSGPTTHAATARPRARAEVIRALESR